MIVPWLSLIVSVKPKARQSKNNPKNNHKNNQQSWLFFEWFWLSLDCSGLFVWAVSDCISQLFLVVFGLVWTVPGLCLDCVWTVLCSGIASGWSSRCSLHCSWIVLVRAGASCPSPMRRNNSWLLIVLRIVSGLFLIVSNYIDFNRCRWLNFVFLLFIYFRGFVCDYPSFFI